MKTIRDVKRNIVYACVRMSRCIPSTAIALLAGLYVNAQKGDTLTPIRDFIAVSTGYKQIPMYLNIEMRNSSNVVSSEEDTLNIQGEFFIQKDQSYVRFGEFEQLVNDSMALLVSNKMQAMILYTNAAPVVKQMQAMMGAAIPDSSVKNMAGRYSSTYSQSDKKTTVIELQSRIKLFGTSLFKELIRMEYSTQSRLPEKVITTRRSLVPIDSIQYSSMKKEAGSADQLLALEGSYYIIKEQVSAYLYKKIERGTGGVVPVTISDRVTRSEDGSYKPVKGYENYLLSKND